MGQSMTKLTINRKPKGIYGTPQKTTQAAQEQDKTTSAHKVMPGNQKAQQKPTGATPWRHMTKRQRKTAGALTASLSCGLNYSVGKHRSRLRWGYSTT